MTTEEMPVQAASKRWLGVVLLVALGLRLLPLMAHGAYPAVFMDADSWGYHNIAQNWLAGNGYSWDSSPPYLPNAYRPPGLPGMLMLMYAVTGVSIPNAILLQVVVSTLTVGLTYALARALGARPAIALTAAALLAVDPVTIYYTNFILTEMYTSMVVVLALMLGARYLQTGGHGYAALIGLLLAGSILVHPILLFTPASLIVLPLFSGACRTRRHVGVAVLIAVLAWLPALGWIVRNHCVADYRGISCVAAVNLLKYKAAGVNAELKGSTRERERDLLVAEIAVPADATPGQRWRAWETHALAILRAHPLVYAKVHVRGMLMELLGPERDWYFRFVYGPRAIGAGGRVSDEQIHRARETTPLAAAEWFRWPVLALQGTTILLWVAGFLSVLIAMRRPRLALGLLLPVLYVLALSGGPEAGPRFRTIYTPTLCIFAAFGVETIRNGLRRWWPATNDVTLAKRVFSSAEAQGQLRSDSTEEDAVLLRESVS